MRLYKRLLLVLLLSIGNVSSSSYANVVYSNSKTEVNCPVDRKKPVKKKGRKKFRKKAQKKSFFRITKKNHKSQLARSIIEIIVLLLILLLPMALIIIGGITGGIGWIIAGSILLGLMLVFGYLLALSEYYLAIPIGMLILGTVFLTCLALLIWALIASLPLILLLSIIFGSIALLGFLIPPLTKKL
jgi:hypothetical protein